MTNNREAFEKWWESLPSTMYRNKDFAREAWQAAQKEALDNRHTKDLLSNMDKQYAELEIYSRKLEKLLLQSYQIAERHMISDLENLLEPTIKQLTNIG